MDFSLHWSHKVTPLGVPESPEELMAYLPVFRAAAKRAGIPYEELDDAVSELMAMFLERGGVSTFDPTRGTRFASMLKGFAAVYVLRIRQRHQMRLKHIPYHLDPEWDPKAPTDPVSDLIEQIGLSQVLNQIEDPLHKAIAERCLSAPASERISNASLARDLGVTPRRVKVALEQMRESFKALHPAHSGVQ